jgi:hypothetical protein
VCNDAQQDGPNRGRRQRSSTRDAFVEHDDGEHDAGQTARPEPADEELVTARQARARQREEHGNYANEGQAQERIEDDRERQDIARLSDHHRTEHDPGQQCQRLADPFGGAEDRVLLMTD